MSLRFLVKARPGPSMKLLPTPSRAAIFPPAPPAPPPPSPSPFRPPPRSPFRPPPLAGPLPSRLFFCNHGHTWAEIKSALKEKMKKAEGVVVPILEIAVVSFVQAFMSAMAKEVHTRLMHTRLMRKLLGAIAKESTRKK